MSGEDELPFFGMKGGEVYARWRSGRAPERLGPLADVHAAMEELLRRSRTAASEAPEAVPAPAPPELPEEPVASEPTQNERASQRHDTSILGRIRTASGARDVTVRDLSEQGCRFHDRFGQMAEGTSLTIKLGPVGPVDATVRWRRGEYVGVQFANPLYPSVLEHIRQHFDLRR